MCGGNGFNPISAIQAEADRAAAKLRAERDRAAQKAKAERDRVTSKVEAAASAAGTSIQDIIKGAISETKKSIPKSDHQPIVVSRERFNTILGGTRNFFSGGRDYSRDLRRMRDRATKPPVVKPPEVNLPSVNIPKPAPLPSPNIEQITKADPLGNITPNMDQDLTKVNNQTVQNAVISATSDVQAAAQKLGSDVQDAAISTASDVQAGVIKAGSDVQDLAIKTGSDVQQGVIDITSKTGLKNETVENIISSNVKGTEESLQTIVKGAEDELAKNVAGGKGTLQTIVKGAEDELDKNVKGLEGSIEDIVTKIEDFGTLLTGGTGGSGDSGSGNGDTGGGGGVTPITYEPSPPPGPKPPPLGGASDSTARTFSEEERKRAKRILQASRYGRRNTMLTGGSGLTNFGV